MHGAFDGTYTYCFGAIFICIFLFLAVLSVPGNFYAANSIKPSNWAAFHALLLEESFVIKMPCSYKPKIS